MAKLSKNLKIKASQKRAENRKKYLGKRRIRNPYLIEQIWDKNSNLSDLEKTILVIVSKHGIPIKDREILLPKVVKSYLKELPIEKVSEALNVTARYIESYYFRIQTAIFKRYGSLQNLKNLLKNN